MTWLRDLHGLSPADLPLVGYKAYYLGLLGQRQLPIAPGQVLTTQAWQAMLTHLSWAGDPLGQLEEHNLDEQDLQSLRTISHQAQQAFNTTHLPPAYLAELPPSPLTPCVLQASLWLNLLPERAKTLNTQGLLPAQIITPATGFPAGLYHFWSQALSAPSLVVWHHHCRHLSDLGLATLITPLYPALASGTLTLQDGLVKLRAVLGLGLPLSRGEAIPARCQLTLDQPHPPVWEDGFQEQLYQVAPLTSATHLDLPVGSAVDILPRESPSLPPPLTDDQLQALLLLGQQAHTILTEQSLNPGQSTLGTNLEWILSPSSEQPGWQLIITQAKPCRSPVSQPSKIIVPQAPEPPPRFAPPLPAVSTVVQGIGASSGQVRGVAIVATQPQDLPSPLPAQAIVVLPDLQPDVFLQLESVAGIVTERGGATCHAAILAREIGVPAVVGAPQSTQLLESGTVLWLDGDRGLVYGLAEGALSNTQAPTLAAAKQANHAQIGSRPIPHPMGVLRTKVMANLSQVRRLSTLPMDQIAGIGLLRSEWLLLEVLEGRHPWHWVNHGQEAELQHRIVQQLEPVLAALGSKPLRYRSLDLRSHEWQALEGSPPLEPNPMLGMRGTLSYDIDARLFGVELAALATLQRSGYTDLQLILPFVRTVEEVLACKPLIHQAGLTAYPDFALWIMAEVPSVLFLLPAYAQAGVQGIAIGSNDLTQLLLAVDRDQPTMASAYDERHPVVRMAMAYLIQEAQRCGITCSICGQAPVRHPDLIADLVAWGISSISVEAAALPFTLEAVWQAEQALNRQP